MAEVTASRPSDMETTFPVWDDAKVEDIINAEGGAPPTPPPRRPPSRVVALRRGRDVTVATFRRNDFLASRG